MLGFIRLNEESCINNNDCVINVKLTFEEHSLIKALKFKTKSWFGPLREYDLVVMHWAEPGIKVGRETQPRAAVEEGLLVHQIVHPFSTSLNIRTSDMPIFLKSKKPFWLHFYLLRIPRSIIFPQHNECRAFKGSLLRLLLM